MTRLVLLGIAKVSGCDFRAPLFVNALLLGALAGAMIWLATRLRGHASYLDVFFPLVLLNLGHERTFLEGWNIQNVIFTVLSGVILLIMAGAGLRLRGIEAIVAGLCLVLLPLNGAAGVAVLPLLAVGLIYGSLREWRERTPKEKSCGVAAVGLALAALAILPLYFRGFESVGYQGQDPGQTHPALWQTALGTLMFLTIGFGAAARAIWPWSGVLVAALLGSALVGWIMNWRFCPGDRPRLIGLGLFVGAVGCVGAGIAFGRWLIGPDFVLQSHYAILSAPALCCLYLWTCSARPKVLGRALQIGLTLSVMVLSWPNLQIGWRDAREHHERTATFERDLRAGMPGPFLAYKHDWLLPRWRKEDQIAPQAVSKLESCFQMLRSVRVGAFSHLHDMPPNRAIRIPVVVKSLHNMRWEDGQARGDGPESWLSLAIGPKQHVYGIILQVPPDQKQRAQVLDCRVSWTSSRDNREHAMSFELTPGEDHLAIWVDDQIDELRIRPDIRAAELSITSIVLLVPR
jgi:hypothetical protein